MNPRIWQLALVGIAFGLAAAGSCARVVDHGPYPGVEAYESAFLVSGLLSGGALLLLGFRLPHPRRQAWPGICRTLLTGAASLALTIGSFAGAMAMVDVPAVRRHAPARSAHVVLVTSAVGAVATLGSAALLAVGVGRRMRYPERLS